MINVPRLTKHRVGRKVSIGIFCIKPLLGNQVALHKSKNAVL